MDDPRKFAAPEYVYGKGALPLVVQYATNFDIYSAFIVTDPGVIRGDHVDKVVRLFKHEGFGVEVFDSISPGPRAEEVMMGAQAFDDSGCELIIALGGGSPMDAAKTTGMVSANHRHVLEHEGVDRVHIPGPPLICVPTTAGTASDISQLAIVTIGFERHRVAIFSKCLIPDVAIIDPETTLTMDRTSTALAGLDAFANAIEAVRLIFRHLPMAVEKPEDIDSRWGVMLGSLHGGLAFSNASLGLNTAMAHSVGGYLDLPHGECNAALLEHAVGADYGFAETKYDRIAEVMGLNPDGLDVAEKIARLKEGILSFKQRVGATRTIADMGMRAQHIPLLVKRTLQDPCMATNPGYFSPKELEDIYGKAL
jgi:alcohol dehydrogenase class IV